MRARLVVIAALVSFGGPSFAQGWIEYENREQFFSVNFPGQPEQRDIDYTSEYGAIYPAKVFTVEQGASRYSVTVVDFGTPKVAYVEPDDKTDDTTLQSLAIYDQLGATAQAARGLRERGGDVTFDAWHQIDRVEGHMLQITNPDRSRTFASIYLHLGRLYVLEATVPERSPPPGLFQQSLSFLDANGNRLRYRLDPDGKRTRLE